MNKPGIVKKLNFVVIKQQKNIRQVQYRDGVFEIQRRKWFWAKWKTMSFGDWDIEHKQESWFIGIEIANECYNDAISA